jgi:radical SAM superfamily enzyme YgiQ (UPF0313 family)
MHFHLIAPRWPKIPEQSPFHLPPLGLIQVAACAPPDVEVSVTDETVEEIDFEGNYDLVGISSMLTCSAPRGWAIADEFRARGVPVVMGGMHVALCPEECLQHADAVVLGEGEGLVEELIADFRRGELKRLYGREGFLNMAGVPDPRRDLYDKKAHYSYKGWELMDLVQTSRGCRFNCSPCTVPRLRGHEHRIRPWEHVQGDLDDCTDLVFIVDNSLEQNPEYEKELFRHLRDTGKRWVSHPISPEPENLKAAREAGCWYVYHAIYTISDKIRDRVKRFHDHGIAVEGTILLGLDHHTEDFIKRFTDFLLSIELDLAEFTVATPFPNTPFYDEMAAEGRIIDHDLSHYNAATVVFKPRQMSPERLQELYQEAWRCFYAEESQSARMSRLFMNLMRTSPRRLREGLAPNRAKRRQVSG